MIPLDVAPKFVRSVEGEVGSPVAGNFVRVILSGSIPRDAWENVKEWMLKDKKARWAEEWIELPEAQMKEVKGPYTPNVDLEDMLDIYVNEVAAAELDKELLKEMGHEFLRSSR